MRKLFVLIPFVLFSFSAAYALDETAYTSWTEDIGYILSMEKFDNVEKWLENKNSGYECERDEKDDTLTCSQMQQEKEACLISVNKENWYITAECGAEKMDDKNRAREMYEELIEIIDEAYEDFVFPHRLPISNEEWEVSVDYLYFINRKMTSFDYWLFGNKTVFSNMKTEKGKFTVSVNIIDAGRFVLLAEEAGHPEFSVN